MKKRVLVFGFSDNRGGTEAVIENYAKELAKQGFCFDFACEEALKREIATEGGNRYFVLPAKRKNVFGYKIQLNKLFQDHAREYCAVWCNMNSLSNIDPLKYAYKYEIPNRIVHAHNSKFLANQLQFLLSEIHRGSVRKYANHFIACSDTAGRFFFENSAFSIINNAIMLSDYSYSIYAREKIRKEFGLEDRFVVGAVGRFVEQKNYSFLVRLLPQLLREKPNTALVLLGDGTLRKSMEEEAKRCGVCDQLVLPGARSDVSDFLSAFDVLAMPSLFEGLPVSLVEAQANGLPCVVSCEITREVAISESVEFCDLDNTQEWVNALLSASRDSLQYKADSLDSFDIMKQSTLLKRHFTS